MGLKPFNDITVYGEALETFGFEAYQTIDGFGLLTFGFLWECAQIWTDSESTLATSWTNSESAITTNWSNSDPSLTTNWSDTTGWSEC